MLIFVPFHWFDQTKLSGDLKHFRRKLTKTSPSIKYYLRNKIRITQKFFFHEFKNGQILRLSLYDGNDFFVQSSEMGHILPKLFCSSI